MPDKKQNGDNTFGPDSLNNMTDEELMEFVRKEGSKDNSVLAKLIMIQRIRQSLVRERLWQRIMTGSAIILSILALIIGVGGYLTFHNFLQDRDQRTITACNTTANNSIAFNKGLEQQVDTLYFIESVSVSNSNPTKKAFVNAVVDGQVVNIRKNYQRVRDCSNAGIQDYNISKGVRGYLDGPQVEQVQRRDPVTIQGA